MFYIWENICFNLKMEPREKIIQACLRVYNRVGYGGAHLTEIAREAKMSKQRVLYYFKNTDDIIYELAQRWGERGRQVTLERLAESTLYGCLRIEVMAQAMFDWVKKEPELSRFTLVLFQVAPHIKGLSQIHNSTLQTGCDRIVSFLQSDEQYRKLNLRKIESLAKSIHMTMLGSLLYILAFHQQSNLAEFEERGLQSIRALLKEALNS